MHEDLIYYQLKAEVALEDGNIEEAKVYAALAQSAAALRFGSGLDRDEAKEKVRNGERVRIPGPGPDRMIERHRPTGPVT